MSIRVFNLWLRFLEGMMKVSWINWEIKIFLQGDQIRTLILFIFLLIPSFVFWREISHEFRGKGVWIMRAILLLKLIITTRFVVIHL
jgi:hypothetical protein